MVPLTERSIVTSRERLAPVTRSSGGTRTAAAFRRGECWVRAALVSAIPSHVRAATRAGRAGRRRMSFDDLMALD